MRSDLLRLADKLRGSYWLLPSIMAVGAMGLASGMIYLDSHAGPDWMDAADGFAGYDLERVLSRATDLRKALAEPDYQRRLRDSSAWLGGTA